MAIMPVRRLGTTESPLLGLRDEMDRLLEGFLQEWPPPMRPGHFGRPAYPPLNLWEDDANLYLEAELPGLKTEGVNVSVVGQECTIKGERLALEEPESAMWLRRERAAGTFHRTIRLPVEVEPERVEAALADGILTVTLPKTKRAARRRIEVKVARD